MLQELVFASLCAPEIAHAWLTPLIAEDLERLENSSTAGDLYIRMGSMPPAKGKTSGKRNVIVVASVVSIAAAVIISCFCFCYPWRKLKNKETHQNLLLLELNSNEPVHNKHTSVSNGREDERNNQHDLPIFSFSSVAASL